MGKVLPLMQDLAEVVSIKPLLGHDADPSDFETTYSRLVSDEQNADRCAQIETAIYDYFASLRLPNEATVYDYLVLSLRPKDVIATFNWDPFLVQAMQRCYRVGHRSPELLFLHGNVAVGVCTKDWREGALGQTCSACGQPFTRSRLLYPVGQKDYESDPMIAAAWRDLRGALQRAFMVTIFGYSAPVSDRSAVDLMRDAWGDPKERQMEQFEIIDKPGRDPEELRSTWSPFIHSHHYDVFDDFFQSCLASHPRRSGEVFRTRIFEGKWPPAPNPAPRNVSLDTVRRWSCALEDIELSRPGS